LGSDLPGLRCGDCGNEELVALMLPSPAALRQVRPMHQANGCFRPGNFWAVNVGRGHVAEGHEWLQNGVDLDHRTADCREHPQSA
jgi:hypothetical protein